MGENLNHLHKRTITALVIAVLALVLCVFMISPGPIIETQVPAVVAVSPVATDNVVQIKDVQFSHGSFGNQGIYLCRPETVHAENVYKETISTADLIENNNKSTFHPEFQALVRRNDAWENITDDANADFWIETEEDGTNYSVAWYLRETAPAAVYGVRCIYLEDYGDYEETVEVEYQVLYTEYWTYVNVTNNDGERRIRNFSGGRDLTLYLNVTFNDGAADPSLAYTDQTTGSTDVRIGAISSSSNVVSVNSMEITIKTASGKGYSTENILYEIDSNVNNRVALRFLESLGNDVYMVQFSSRANNRIIGQFVIDNTDAKGGVNLSQIWVFLMIFGGVLALGAASAYLVPLIIVKVNEARVNKETERIDRIKNPEKYANKDKVSFKERINKVIDKVKTPAYKRKQQEEEQEKAAQAQSEGKVYTNRFTEMLRERQEKRDFMREHNVSSAEMEKMKEAEVAAAADEVNSFAALRDDDDDDEIATFHAAQDDISTLETGSYVQGGTTFAQLDSMRNEEKPQDGNDDNNGNNNGGF